MPEVQIMRSIRYRMMTWVAELTPNMPCNLDTGPYASARSSHSFQVCR